jgi:RNA polymerase sigma factor (sigma-70 family)
MFPQQMVPGGNMLDIDVRATDSTTPTVTQPMADRQQAEAVFLDNLPLINAVIGSICSRGVRPNERDDFRSAALLKLIENDYEVLRRFAGRSQLRTYLTIVFKRVLLDERVRTRGKWHPSAAAKRLGPDAVRLEQLRSRDGLTRHEALQVTAGSRDPDASRWLERLARRLPDRARRCIEGEDMLANAPDPRPLPDAYVAMQETVADARRIRKALRRAYAALDPEDQLIVKLRFVDGLKVADIARVLSTDQKALYRRVGRILVRIRHRMQSDGVSEAVARGLTSTRWSDLPDVRP